MRTFIFCIALVTLLINAVSGQTRIVLDGPNLIDSTKTPLVIVDSFRTVITHLVLDPQKIDSINIFKDSTAISKFGDAGKFGVIIIYPKKYVTLLRVDKILENYKLSNEDKKLRICINKILMRDPQLILIESSEIENVEVTTEINYRYYDPGNRNEKFINIITRQEMKDGL